MQLCLNSIFDLTCFTYLWYVWHDTDPFAGVRLYGFPLVNVIFQAGSAYFLSLLFNMLWCENNSTLRKCKSLHIFLRLCKILNIIVDFFYFIFYDSYILLGFCILFGAVFAFILTVATHLAPFFHLFQDLNLNIFHGVILMLSIYLLGFTHYFLNSVSCNVKHFILIS